MRVALSIPPDNDRSPLYLESALATLHRMLSRRHRITLGYILADGGVTLHMEMSDEIAPSVVRQLRAAYPWVCVQEQRQPGDRTRLIRRWLVLCPKWAPLKTWESFTDQADRTIADPVAAMLSSLADAKIPAEIRFIVRPVPEWRRQRRQRRLSARCKDNQELEQKLADRLFAVGIKIYVEIGKDQHRAGRQKLRELEAALGQLVIADQGRFRRCLIWPRSSLLSVKELATLWHPPVSSVKTDRLERSAYRRLEPPVDLPSVQGQEEIAVLGRVDFPDRDEVFGLPMIDRLRHLVITGKTGCGKSTLLERLFLSDAEAGHGVAILDPHGDLADNIAAAIPKRRTNNVIFFDASDRDYPIAFNPLACPKPEQRPLVASGIVGAFKKLHADSWGPRLEHILRNAVLALVETPGTTLLSLQQILTDSPYRARLVSELTDPVVRGFWEHEFARWKPQFQAEAVAPVLNKIGPLLSNPILRGIVGQEKSRLNLRTVLDQSKLLICNLSQGRIGEDTATLLGSFLISSLQIAALSRADMPASKRIPFFITCDEFQTLSTEAFTVLLSQSRKYGIGLTLATQYLKAVDESVRDAIFGNAGSMLAFQVSPDDAETLAFQFGGDVTPRDLMGLPKYHAVVRLLFDGAPTRPFTMTTMPPENRRESRLEVVRRVTRRGYSMKYL